MTVLTVPKIGLSYNKHHVVRVTLAYLDTFLQSPPSARRPTFGDTFALNPMFTFFVVQTRLHFLTAANYEIYLAPNLADGGLCSVPRVSL